MMALRDCGPPRVAAECARLPGPWNDAMPQLPLLPKVVRAHGRMAMPVCAYSCVIDTVNAAVFNAEIRIPMCWPWGVRAQPDRRFARSAWPATVVVLCARRPAIGRRRGTI